MLQNDKLKIGKIGISSKDDEYNPFWFKMFVAKKRMGGRRRLYGHLWNKTKYLNLAIFGKWKRLFFCFKNYLTQTAKTVQFNIYY